jgi:RNA polymerase sigma factor (TIGR02999 family)
MVEVSRILSQIEAGDPTAADQLLPLVYDELRQLAAAHLGREKSGQTLQATALVHEAYLKIVGGDANLSFADRKHFFAAAAQAMRRILINSAIRKQRHKHGGAAQRIDFDEQLALDKPPDTDIIQLDAALRRLEEIDPQVAEIVHLKYFAGLSLPQVAEFMGLSPRTVDRRWAYARAWLHCELEK